MTLADGPSLLLEHALTCLRATAGLRPGDRVMAAMSGGIDSSVMAALLHRAGYEVVGVSMQLFDKTRGGTQPETEGKCCTLDDFQDARRVAFQCGFPHYVLDLESRFQETVIEPFVAGYLSGETPSPCIRCNQFLKFRTLLDSAADLGCAFVATGHYAQVTRDDRGYHLLKAADAAKDQSYFLFTHDQASLAMTLFPLAGFSKPEVRQLARDLGLHLADKAESQEICFVPGRYDAYIEEAGLAPASSGGPIRHLDGRILGRHEGYWRYTVGQRKGLGVSHPTPLFVVRVDPATDTVWVGAEDDLLGTELVAGATSWCLEPPGGPFPCKARIRSRSAEVEALVEPLGGGRVRVRFAAPQRAIAAGQAVVFYAGPEVLGGGWIERPEFLRELNEVARPQCVFGLPPIIRTT